MITVVVDNTVVSNFAHTLQPGLVSAAFEQPVTVPAVVEELSAGVSLGRIPVVDWHWLPFASPEDYVHDPRSYSPGGTYLAIHG